MSRSDPYFTLMVTEGTMVVNYEDKKPMAKCKNYDFEHLVRLENQPGLEGKAVTHHMRLFHLVAGMQSPTVLEFGVDKGLSTCILLAACEKTQGQLLSVDIQDCSDIAVSHAWTFIKADDRDIDIVLQAAPPLAKGIDLLHIDTVHTGEHVTDLLMKWFPYVKPNGYLTFHDVDETPFKVGQRKENREIEREYMELAAAIKGFFYANESHLFLEFHFGSTGMAIMKKLGPMGIAPCPPVLLKSAIGIKASTQLLLGATRRRLFSARR